MSSRNAKVHARTWWQHRCAMCGYIVTAPPVQPHEENNGVAVAPARELCVCIFTTSSTLMAARFVDEACLTCCCMQSECNEMMIVMMKVGRYLPSASSDQRASHATNEWFWEVSELWKDRLQHSMQTLKAHQVGSRVCGVVDVIRNRDTLF